MQHRLVFFGATYVIALSIDSLFCVSKICSGSLRTSSIWNGKIVFSRRFYSWFSFYFKHNPSSLLLYYLTYADALVLKHHSALQLSRLINMWSREILPACRNFYKLFFLFFFIIYPQFLLILRSSTLVHLHRWSLLSLTTENMCLAANFTWWEGSGRKDDTGISS